MEAETKSREYNEGFADGLLSGRELDASDRVYLAEITMFGRANQIVIAMERMSELIKELSKQLRGTGDAEHITEEMADVYIMLRELEIMLGNSTDVELAVAEKTARLRARVENGEDSADCGVKECYFFDAEEGGENEQQTRRQGSHYQVGG